MVVDVDVPTDLDLDHVIATRFGPRATRIVRTLEAERRVLDQHAHGVSGR